MRIGLGRVATLGVLLIIAFATRPALGAEVEPPYPMPPLWKALVGDLHNKIIHFPIVLTLVATFSLWWGRRRTDLEPVCFWLVWITALSTLAAYFSGQAQAPHYMEGPKAWLVTLHARQGIVIGVGQALWVLSLLRDRTRPLAWVLGVILSVIVLSAGFLGGLVAHGK